MTVALPVRGWILLAVLWALAIAVAFATRFTWGPDSRLYLAWTYWYLGHSQIDSAHMSYDYLHNNPGLLHCVDTCWPAGYEKDFFTGQYAAVVGPRVLLPLLSAPLVLVFGPGGMMLVPALAYAGAVICTVLLASRMWGQRWALLAGVLMLLPTYISRYAAVAHTEGTAILLTAWPVLFLPLMRRTSRRDVVWFSVLIGLGMANRQFAIALPFGVVAVWAFVVVRDKLWRRPWRTEWFPFALWGSIVGVAVLAVQMLVAPRIFGGAGLSLTALFNMYSEKFFHTSGIPAIPTVLWHIISDDYYGVRDDIVLMALLAASIVAVGWRFRSELAVLTFGCFLAVSAINVLEFWPTSFRYHVPVVPLLVLSVVALAADLCGPVRRRPSRSREDALPVATGPRFDAPRFPVLMLEPRRRGLRWLDAIPVAGWVALIGLGTVVMAILYHRTWHFSPDSRYHLAWAGRYLGENRMQATGFVWREFSDEGFFTDGDCVGGCWQAGTGWLFGHATSVDPNLFYPLISAPFVYLFNDDGLQTVPFFSFVIAALALTVFAARRWGMGTGLTAGLVFVISDRVVLSGVTGLPDMVGLALCMLCLFTLPLDGPRSRRALAGFSLLVLLALMTRSSALALVGAVGVAWLFEARKSGLRNRWAPYLVISAAAAALIVALGQIFAAADARYLGRLDSLFRNGLSGAVSQIWETAHVDGGYVANDLVVTCVLLGAVVAMVTRSGKDPIAALALGGTAVCVLLQVVGGVANGPRGFSMIYPILLLAAVAWMRVQLAAFGNLPPVQEPARESSQEPVVQDLDAELEHDLATVLEEDIPGRAESPALVGDRPDRATARDSP
jgi:hypothetical protein